MARRYSDSRFTRTCDRADKVLNILCKPIETLAKITIHLSLILGFFLCIFTSSNDKTLLIASLLLNLGFQYQNRKKEHNDNKSILV